MLLLRLQSAAALTPSAQMAQILQSQKGITEYVQFLHEYPEILQPNGAVNDMMLAMLFGGAPPFS